MVSGSSSGNYDSGWRLEDAFVAMTVGAGESPARTPGQQKCRTGLAGSDSDEECNALQEQEVSAHRINETGRATNTGSDGEPPDLADTGERQTTQKKKRKNHRGGSKKKGKKNLEPVGQADAATEDRGKVGSEIVASEGQSTEQPSYSPKLYEIKSSPGKGLGVFAVQNIERGTRIMCEEPLIYLPGRDLIEVTAAFAKLSPDRQAVFLSLRCRPLGGDVDTRRETLLRAHPLMSLRASALNIPIEQLRVMAIHETNSFEAEEGSVICVEASRINHSCLPNVHHCWNVTIGAETVHAVRNIAKGEEIFTTYIRVCEARAQREQHLDRYGFECSCPACEASTFFGKESERRRRRLFQIDQALAMHSQTAVFSPFHHDRQALHAVQENVRLLKEEGLDNMELTRNYREAATFSAITGNIVAACEWAEKAMKNTEICAGTDYEGYKIDEETLHRLIAKREGDGDRRSK